MQKPWGKAWCKNLERYSDYSNRVGRGRSYVKNGFIFDLKIFKGKVISLVQGTRATPYTCEISFNLLSKSKWEKIQELTESRFKTLEVLLKGQFPKELQEIFSEQGTGIFPTPKEIKFDCSCPDWASMCKHIAATLYAIGAKLDKHPELLFSLRGVNMSELIGSALEKHKNSLLKTAKNIKSNRVLDVRDSSLGKLFDIEFNS
jgi:uncharacterized Zn finger protein